MRVVKIRYHWKDKLNISACFNGLKKFKLTERQSYQSSAVERFKTSILNPFSGRELWPGHLFN